MLDMIDSYKLIRRFYTKERTLSILRLAKKLDKVEEKNSKEFISKIYSKLDDIVDAIIRGENPSLDGFTFRDEIINSYYRAYKEGIESADSECRHKVKKDHSRLAYDRKKEPKIRTKKQLDEDIKRIKAGKKKLTKQQQKDVDALNKSYINSITKTFNEFKESGKTHEEIKMSLKENLKTTESHAEMINRTETNKYYNKARVIVFDEDEFVTHYQFLSIRDSRRTEWCSDRHGLIYKKGDQVTNYEIPPIHWNCRSIFSPLDIFNDYDKKLINTYKIQRENNTCKPLPRGWIPG